MTDVNQPTPNPPTPHRIRRNLSIGALAFAAVASLTVLYGISGQHDKEMAAASECKTAQSTAKSLTSLARGEVAALTIESNPKPMVNISFSGPQGQKRSLADFRGRTVLLNLWATWCVPCRQEMPALDRLQSKLGSDDFEVVAINIDTARLERRQAFLKEVGVKSLAFYADPTAEVFEGLKEAGKAVGLPTTLLLDPHGCTLGTMSGPAQWDSPDGIKLVTAALAKYPNSSIAPSE